MIASKAIAVLVAMLANATWADADTVDVTDRGPVDLAAFTCTDITRSSLLSRACYDANRRYAVIAVQSTYRQFCDVPQTTLDALLNAPSMGQFYKARMQAAAGQPYACAPASPADRSAHKILINLLPA